MSEANRARVQQIVAECFVKAAHIILGSRIYQSSRILSKQGPKCWVCCGPLVLKTYCILLICLREPFVAALSLFLAASTVWPVCKFSTSTHFWELKVRLSRCAVQLKE